MTFIRRWAMTAVTAVLAAIVAFGMITGAGDAPDRGRQLASRLRCPVCQAESVADSPAETARQMNQLIVEQVAAGRSDREILEFFRQRYGDWVLLDPPTSGRTVWVWVLPAAALVVGLAVVFGRGGRRVEELEHHLTAADRARVAHAVGRARRATDEAEDDDDGDLQ